MPLVSTSIPNLLNGVSQQPSALRQVTQGETQNNALSSVIDGLIKRPPTEHLAKVNNSAVSNAAIHLIDRGLNQRHVLVIETNANGPAITINMFDIEGNSVPVKDINGNTISGSTYSGTLATYLAAGSAEADLEFLTVADFTFLLNKQKTVSLNNTTVSGSLASSNDFQGFEDLPIETSNHHVGDGNTTTFPIGFKYINSNHVTVAVNGIQQTVGVNNDWLINSADDTTIKFNLSLIHI